MYLRDAEIADSNMLFEWANDSEIRKMAFSSEPIELEGHETLLTKKLIDPNTYIYIAISNNGEPIGQIRFEITSKSDAEVDVHTRPSLRGKGIGTQIILLGVSRFLKQSSVKAIHAIIKSENAKSMRAFTKSGFIEIEKKTIHGHECFHMVKRRG